MKISKIVTYDLLTALRSWFTYFSLILCILPAGAIAYSVANFEAPFDTTQLIAFFAFFGSLLVVINAMLAFTKDLSQNTIILMMNQSGNRMKYFLSKIISIGCIGLLFGLVCLASTYALSTYAGLDFDAALYWKIPVTYVIYTLFYGGLFLLISIYFTNFAALFIISLISIVLLPSLFNGLLFWDKIPDSVVNFLEDSLPLYYLPDLLNTLEWQTSFYISSIVAILLFTVLGMLLIRRKDY
ncbi:ABC transporter permease subunit [Jeotgalicoccus huakuii]|nr:ABC transporter permease subunit [Jeotgalicoccus huakuii]